MTTTTIANPSPERLGLPVEHLKIGECIFTRRPVVICTVLGSCVSATFFHPGARAAGMFHAMLPSLGSARDEGLRPCNYADSAVDLLLERFVRLGIRPGTLTVKLFGGGNVMPARNAELDAALDVGRKNVESARIALARHGVRIAGEHVLGPSGRKVYLCTADGRTWLRYVSATSCPQFLEHDG